MEDDAYAAVPIDPLKLPVNEVAVTEPATHTLLLDEIAVANKFLLLSAKILPPTR